MTKGKGRSIATAPLPDVGIDRIDGRRAGLHAPRSRATSKGWLTFGFHRDLNEAWTIAAREMVRLMEELYRLKPKEALSLAGLVAHLSITQAVNGVRGVHAFLPHDAGTVKPGACSSALAREDAVHRARSSLRRESGRRRCRPRRW